MYLDLNTIKGVLGLALGLMIAGCSSGPSPSKVILTQSKTNVSAPKNDVKADVLSGRHACDDLPIVVVEEEYDNGQVSLQQEVVINADGEQVFHGLMTHYWQNGKKKLQIEYHCGQKHGLRASWYQDGQPWSVGEHFYGKDHGEWIVWFADGKKQRQFTINAGVWDGAYTSWHANGQTKISVVYANGRRQGPSRLWDDKGNLAREIQYADDKVQPSPR